MKKEYIVTFVLILCFFIFACWLDNTRVKERNELNTQLSSARDEIDQLKDENLMLNYQLCVTNNDNGELCQKVRKDIAMRVLIMDMIEDIYNKKFKDK